MKISISKSWKEILDSEFSDFQDLKRKYDAFLSLEVSHRNMYKTLKENKNKLNNFKSKIITMLDNTDFVDLIEKDMVKMNQVNLINVALISIILGLSLGIMIILFRHSIKS